MDTTKKVYAEPQIRTEGIEAGVYGDYGSSEGGGGGGCTPIHFLNPLFHWCCS